MNSDRLITIRNASVCDAEDIAELTAQLGYPADAQAAGRRLARIIGQRDQLVLVAILDNEIVAWIQAQASEGWNRASGSKSWGWSFRRVAAAGESAGAWSSARSNGPPRSGRRPWWSGAIRSESKAIASIPRLAFPSRRRRPSIGKGWDRQQCEKCAGGAASQPHGREISARPAIRRGLCPAASSRIREPRLRGNEYSEGEATQRKTPHHGR